MAGEQLDTGVTPITRKLLAALGRPRAREPVLFCQREAAETAIFLAEVAGRHGDRRLPATARRRERAPQRRPAAGRAEDGDRHRQDRRDGDADRLADDQQGRTPARRRFAKRFLVVTPGITIRDRLRVLQPERRGQLLPRARPRARPTCGRRCCRRRSSSPTTTRSCRGRQGDQGRRRRTPASSSRGGKPSVDPFEETDEQMVAPGAARSRRSSGKRRDRRAQRRGPPLLPGQAARAPTTSRRRERRTKERNARGARVWFKGCSPIAQKRRHQGGLRPVGDAVLPGGLRLQRGLHLPVGGQRLLADGRDRVGHREGPAHPGRRRRRRATLVVPATCGTTSARRCRRSAAKARPRTPTGCRPTTLEGALRSLYRSYAAGVRALATRARARSASRRR